MGAQQALHWGAIFRDRVERICAVCGSARTSVHKKVFTDGVLAALPTDQAWRGPHFDGRPEARPRAVGRLYAGSAVGTALYRHMLYWVDGFAITGSPNCASSEDKL